MIRRKGLGGFVGNSIYWIKGLFSPSYSVTSATIDAPDSSIGLHSIIQSYGAGALSSINSSGAGVQSNLQSSLGMGSIVQSAGQGVNSVIDTTGQSVESKI